MTWLLRITLVLCTSFTLGFVLNKQCPASPPCTCEGFAIRCDSKGLTKVPTFARVSDPYFSLNLSNNAIIRVENGAFANLISLLNLDLSHNKISYVDNGVIKGLERPAILLDLDNNQLSTFPTQMINANKVIGIRLSANLFTSVPSGLQKLMKVQNLDLSNNKIATLGDHDLDHLHGVAQLRLLGNPLTSVSNHAFRNMENLKRLDLENTLLKAFYNDDYLPELTEVNLEGSHISCDCEFRWLLDRRGFPEIHFYGTCSSKTETIMHYIAGDLQKCHHS